MLLGALVMSLVNGVNRNKRKRNSKFMLYFLKARLGFTVDLLLEYDVLSAIIHGEYSETNLFKVFLLGAQ